MSAEALTAGMGLTHDEIVECQSDAFADDVPIIDGMASWTRDQVV